MSKAYGHLDAADETYSVGNGTAGACLYGVTVNTKATSAVVTVYDGTTTAGTVVATIDAATAPLNLNFHGIRLSGGLFVKLTGGNADVTVVAA